MIVFHVLLTVAVTQGVPLFAPTIRVFVCYIVGSAALAASIFGIGLVSNVRDETQGHPGKVSSFSDHTGAEVSNTATNVEDVKAGAKEFRRRMEEQR